ncbi:MAG TPA: DUF4013 domain-containing protein [Candidatus Dormibacteraeota bacterium]|nr:DUF4013 domain-containing protein [Candidatus Dormibacteraeota bacterium]
MTSVGDSFAWPFQDPGWFGKIVVQGLIFIIPIVGWIALVGWLVMTIDNYRANRRELPPAGFHLERGLPLFVVLVVWGVVFAIPGLLLGGGRTSGGTSSLGSLVSFALSLLLAFLTPAIVLKTYRAGFAGGFDVGGVWQMSTGTNTQNTVIAGLLIYVARIIGAIGICAICIGLLFTIPYSVAVTAGVITWFERQMTGPAPAGQTPAAS